MVIKIVIVIVLAIASVIVRVVLNSNRNSCNYSECSSMRVQGAESEVSREERAHPPKVQAFRV